MLNLLVVLNLLGLQHSFASMSPPIGPIQLSPAPSKPSYQYCGSAKFTACCDVPGENQAGESEQNCAKRLSGSIPFDCFTLCMSISVTGLIFQESLDPVLAAQPYDVPCNNPKYNFVYSRTINCYRKPPASSSMPSSTSGSNPLAPSGMTAPTTIK